MAESLQEIAKRAIATECDKRSIFKRDFCDGCPFATSNGVCFIGLFSNGYVDELSKKLMDWATTHPIKTYKDVLLEKFPNAEMSTDGRPLSCRKYLLGGSCFEPINGLRKGCLKCWNEPYEGE